MSLEFSAEDHVYTLDGVTVPSVTQVLARSGLIDFSRIPPFILDAAKKRGTIVHRAIAFYNERDLDIAAFVRDFPDYAPYLAAWVIFCEQRRFVPVLNEHRIASRRYGVAGTLDCLGLLDGRAVLLDFATGRPQDVAKDLQTAAYHALALEWANEQTESALADFIKGRPFLERYAVALRKDGTFRLEPYTNPADFRQFATLVDAQRIVAARRGEQWLIETAA